MPIIIVTYLFKMSAILAAAGSLYLLLKISKTGLELAVTPSSFENYNHLLGLHKRRVNQLLVFTFATLSLVEGFGIFLPRIHQHLPIFKIHLYGFALPFFVMFIAMRIWFTGSRYPILHGFLAWVCIPLGVVADILGACMGYQF